MLEMADLKGQPTLYVDDTISICRFDDRCDPLLETRRTSKQEPAVNEWRSRIGACLPRLSSNNEIRVIEILAGDANEHVNCLMTVQPLGPDHVALSYVWGQDEAEYVIIVNGKKFWIRSNLYRFLRTFQGIGNGGLKLWIDALCIDQTDITERSHQVGMMGKIYSSAQRVIAWLGAGQERLQDGFNFVDNECSAFHQRNKTTLTKTQKVPLWETVLEIFNLEYWSRLWIVQEVLNAKGLSLVYGITAIHWEDICLFANDIQYRRSCPAHLKPMIETSRLMDFVRLKSEGTTAVGSHSMSELIQIYGMNKCADLRDRVFALLPLASDAHKFEVDYSLTSYDLFVLALVNDEDGDENDKVAFMQHLTNILGLSAKHKPTSVNGIPTVVFPCLRCQTHELVIRTKADESWRTALLSPFQKRDNLSPLRPVTGHGYRYLYTSRIRYACGTKGALRKQRQRHLDGTIIFRRGNVEAVHVTSSSDWLKIKDWSLLDGDESDTRSITSVHSASAVSLNSHQRSKSSSTIDSPSPVASRFRYVYEVENRRRSAAILEERKAAARELLIQCGKDLSALGIGEEDHDEHATFVSTLSVNVLPNAVHSTPNSPKSFRFCVSSSDE